MGKLLDELIKYCDDVLSGAEIACKKVKLACKRFKKDLKRSDLVFLEHLAMRAIVFIEQLDQVKGQSGRLRLQPWQRFIIGNLMGWHWANTADHPRPKRRFRVAYCQVARKNGKSTLLSGLAIYMLAFDGELGAEVYSAATSKDQANIVYMTAKQMLERCTLTNGYRLANEFKINDYRTVHQATNSTFKALSSDSDKQDGHNIHCAVVDELHAHPNAGMWDVLADAVGSRYNPLIVAITTAGFKGVGSVCMSQYDYSDKVLKGTVVDDTHFAFVTEIDKGDDWQDPSVWKKANPNLGVSLSVEDLESQCRKAREQPESQRNFMCKRLNVWVNDVGGWLNMEHWNACGEHPLDVESLKGRRCFGGLDLSKTTDATAFVLVFPPIEEGEPWKVIPRIYAPLDQCKLREAGTRTRQMPFMTWADQGHLIATEGNVVDYDFVKADILQACQDYRLEELAYDPYNATHLVTQLEVSNVPCTQYRQGAMSFNQPMKRLEELLLTKQIAHGNHPVLTWMAGNVAVRTDSNNNIAPDKKSAKDNIDAMVALIMGFGLALNAGQEADYSGLMEFLSNEYSGMDF